MTSHDFFAFEASFRAKIFVSDELLNARSRATLLIFAAPYILYLPLPSSSAFTYLIEW